MTLDALTAARVLREALVGTRALVLLQVAGRSRSVHPDRLAAGMQAERIVVTFPDGPDALFTADELGGVRVADLRDVVLARHLGCGEIAPHTPIGCNRDGTAC